MDGPGPSGSTYLAVGSNPNGQNVESLCKHPSGGGGGSGGEAGFAGYNLASFSYIGGNGGKYGGGGGGGKKGCETHNACSPIPSSNGGCGGMGAVKITWKIQRTALQITGSTTSMPFSKIIFDGLEQAPLICPTEYSYIFKLWSKDKGCYKLKTQQSAGTGPAGSWCVFSRYSQEISIKEQLALGYGNICKIVEKPQRLFIVGVEQTLSLSYLELRGGRVSTTSSGINGIGGFILGSGPKSSIQLHFVQIVGDNSKNAKGGGAIGIANGGDLAITSSTFENLKSGAGAIFVEGNRKVTKVIETHSSLDVVIPSDAMSVTITLMCSTPTISRTNGLIEFKNAANDIIYRGPYATEYCDVSPDLNFNKRITTFTKDLTTISTSETTGTVAGGTKVDLSLATTLKLYAFGSGESASGGSVTFEYVFENKAVVTIQDSTFQNNVAVNEVNTIQLETHGSIDLLVPIDAKGLEMKITCSTPKHRRTNGFIEFKNEGHEIIYRSELCDAIPEDADVPGNFGSPIQTFTLDLTTFATSKATGSGVADGTSVNLKNAKYLILFAQGSGNVASGGSVSFSYKFTDNILYAGGVALFGHCPTVKLIGNNVFKGNRPWSISQTVRDGDTSMCSGMSGGAGTSLTLPKFCPVGTYRDAFPVASIVTDFVGCSFACGNGTSTNVEEPMQWKYVHSSSDSADFPPNDSVFSDTTRWDEGKIGSNIAIHGDTAVVCHGADSRLFIFQRKSHQNSFAKFGTGQINSKSELSAAGWSYSTNIIVNQPSYSPGGASNMNCGTDFMCAHEVPGIGWIEKSLPSYDGHLIVKWGGISCQLMVGGILNRALSGGKFPQNVDSIVPVTTRVDYKAGDTIRLEEGDSAICSIYSIEVYFNNWEHQVIENIGGSFSSKVSISPSYIFHTGSGDRFHIYEKQSDGSWPTGNDNDLQQQGRVWIYEPFNYISRFCSAIANTDRFAITVSSAKVNIGQPTQIPSPVSGHRMFVFGKNPSTGNWVTDQAYELTNLGCSALTRGGWAFYEVAMNDFFAVVTDQGGRYGPYGESYRGSNLITTCIFARKSNTAVNGQAIGGCSKASSNSLDCIDYHEWTLVQQNSFQGSVSISEPLEENGISLIAIVGGDPNTGGDEAATVISCEWKETTSSCEVRPVLSFAPSDVPQCDGFVFRSKGQQQSSMTPTGDLVFACDYDGTSNGKIFVLPRKINVPWVQRGDGDLNLNANWVLPATANPLYIGEEEGQFNEDGVKRVAVSISPTTGGLVIIGASPEGGTTKTGPWFWESVNMGSTKDPNRWCSKKCPEGNSCGSSSGGGTQKCGAGTYSDEPGLSACKLCESGKQSLRLGATTACTDVCGVGKFSNATTLVADQGLCRACKIGRYAENEQSSECLDCPEGWSQSFTGQSFCCPPVVNGECLACASAALCNVTVCNSNYFDVNEDITDGCEETCPSVVNGTCDTCDTVNSCSNITCNVNRFNMDDDLSDCETGCVPVANGECLECSVVDTCTTIGSCYANFFDLDDDVSNGCEATCNTVPHANCLTCSFASMSSNAPFLCGSYTSWSQEDIFLKASSSTECDTIAEIFGHSTSCQSDLNDDQIGTFLKIPSGGCETVIGSNGALAGMKASCDGWGNVSPKFSTESACTQAINMLNPTITIVTCGSIGTCDTGYADTDGDAANGCETDLEKLTLENERDSLKIATNTLTTERDTLTEQKSTLTAEKIALTTENEALVTERNTLQSDKQMLQKNNSVLLTEKTTLQLEKSTLETERTTVESEKATLESLLEDKTNIETAKDLLQVNLTRTAATEQIMLKDKINDLNDNLNASKEALLAEKRMNIALAVQIQDLQDANVKSTAPSTPSPSTPSPSTTTSIIMKSENTSCDCAQSNNTSNVIAPLWMLGAIVGLIMTVCIILLLMLCCRGKKEKAEPILAVVAPKQPQGKLSLFMDRNHDKIIKIAHHDHAVRVQQFSRAHSKAKVKRIQKKQDNAKSRLQTRLQMRANMNNNATRDEKNKKKVKVTQVEIVELDKKETKKHQAKKLAKEERKAKKRALKAQLLLERKHAKEKDSVTRTTSVI